MTTSDEAVTNPAEPVREKTRTRGGRYEFLDALRGVAALAVVIQHCSELMWPSYGRFSAAYFGAGVFGVFVFFIASGFIIPASLERGRSLAAFWVSRFFRLFPLFWGCVIAAIVLHFIGMYGGPAGFLGDNPAWNFFTNATMAHWFITGEDHQLLVVAWTLSYELVFYMFVSLLFLAGLNRRSVPMAVLAIGAIIPAGLFLPISLLNGPDSNLTTRLAIMAATVAVAVFFARRAATRRSALAAILLSSLAIPLLLNQPGPSGLSAAIFATMFVGTVLFRMTAGEISQRLGWGVLALAFVAILGLKLITGPDTHPITGVPVTWQWEVYTVGSAYLVFAAALLLRKYSFPRPLLFLGRISFSLYLVHALAINFIPKWTISVLGIPATVLTWCTWVFVSIGLSAVTYYRVEKPFLDLGHRLIAKMDAKPRPVADRA